MAMFNFFKKRAKNKRHSTMDFYELNDQEMDMLMGGSPVRSLLGGADHDNMSWLPNQQNDGSSFQSLVPGLKPFSPSMNHPQLGWASVIESREPRPDYH